MGILDKLLRRDKVADHKKWLEKHPGKGEMHMSGDPIVSDEEQAATRSRMEAEMAEQNAKRNEQ